MTRVLRSAGRVQRLARLRDALSRRLTAPGVLRALLRRLAPLLFAGMVGTTLPGPAVAADWSWFHDDAASHLSYSFDTSTLIFKDQRVRVWVKIYKSADGDEIPLDRVYEEVNCQTNRVRVLTIRPRLEGDDEDSLPIIPFAADAAIPEHSSGSALRRAVCNFTRPETARSSDRSNLTQSGSMRSGRSSRAPKVPAQPPPTIPNPGTAGSATPNAGSGSDGSEAAPGTGSQRLGSKGPTAIPVP